MGLLDTKSSTNLTFKYDIHNNGICITNHATGSKSLYNGNIFELNMPLERIYTASKYYGENNSFRPLIEEELPPYLSEASAIRQFLIYNGLFNELDRQTLNELEFQEKDLEVKFESMNISAKTYKALNNTIYYMFELLLIGEEEMRKKAYFTDAIIEDIANALSDYGYKLPGYNQPIIKSIDLAKIKNMNKICDEILEVIDSRESRTYSCSYVDNKEADKKIKRYVRNLKKEIEEINN